MGNAGGQIEPKKIAGGRESAAAAAAYIWYGSSLLRDGGGITASLRRQSDPKQTFETGSI
jgi:hypothetical protein